MIKSFIKRGTTNFLGKRRFVSWVNLKGFQLSVRVVVKILP